MKLLSPIDVTVLTWLKPELDSTLHQARIALEGFVEEGGGVSSMRECRECLHQVVGILVMVELNGAARLAEEMEQLALSLTDSGLIDAGTAHTLLMQCIVQLPDYLERLQNGHRDVPVVLLPLINELRAIRNEKPLGEESVYAPATQQQLSDAVLSQIRTFKTEKSFQELAASFQEQLPGWQKDPSSSEATAQMASICMQMCAQVQEDSSRKLFWVTSALLDASARGAIDSGKILSRAMTKVSQEVTYLNNQDLVEFRLVSPARLIQELLYLVSLQPDVTEQLRQIYEVFELQQNIPDEQEIEHARGSLLGHNNALVDSVTAVIREDILKIKDSMDMSLRQGDISKEAMIETVGVLTRIEGTLDLVGAGEARSLIAHEKASIVQFINGDSFLDDADLMRIAQSLLSVERMIDRKVLNAPGFRKSKLASDLMAPTHSQQLLEPLIRECIVNFGHVRRAFVAFVENNCDYSQLDAIPALLKQVSGALTVLEYAPISSYIDAINAFIVHEFICNQHIPSVQQTERLAEALASIEYYLESVRDRRPSLERILEITQRSLEALEYWPIPATVRLASVAKHVPELIKPHPDDELPEELVAEISQEPVVPLPPVVLSLSKNSSTESSDELQAVPGFDLKAEGIDDEIREIFLEEFNEESENLPLLMQNWRDDPDNIESVRSIRRIFHTLKGSGRLVGARALSDFSWKIESLLNRVLDQSRPASEPVKAMVGLAIDCLPKFRQALLGERLVLNMRGLAAIAERLADGEEVYYKDDSVKSAGVLESEAIDGVDSISSEGAISIVASQETIDPVLLEILKLEVEGHLSTVNAWLEKSAVVGEALFEDGLFRAMHTMNGAFSMSEVPAMSGLLSPAESLVRRGIAQHASASAEMLACIAQVVDAVQATLEALSSHKAINTFLELESWITALRDSLPEISGSTPLPITPAELETEYIVYEPIEAEPIEAERIEAERIEAERIEAERIEAERIEAERIEAERIEAERIEAERIEAERIEAERIEAERIEAERIEAERIEAERHNAEYYGMSLEELDRLTDPHFVQLLNTDDVADDEAELLPVSGSQEYESDDSAPVDTLTKLDMSDLDEELLDIFTEEAKDLLDECDKLLVDLKANPEQFEPLHALQRHLHTIKGGARMAGLFIIAELSHALESFVQLNTDKGMPLSPSHLQLVEKCLDATHQMTGQVEKRNQPIVPAGLMRQLEPGYQASRFLDISPVSETAQNKSAGLNDAQDLEADEVIRTPQEVVRVRADLLDRLVNFSGEVAIYRARLDQQLSLFKVNLVEMERTTSRLREQLRRLDIETEAQIAARNIREAEHDGKEFDPLELDRFTTQQQLSRSLAESSSDLTNLQKTMEDLTRQHETLLLQQSHVSSELQEGLMRTRMLPFESLLPRLRRVLRQAAEDAGKQATLKVEGAHGEIDRTVLDRMIAPLEHLLRNAVAHGIESAAERMSGNKPAIGTVTISVAHEGTEVVLTVADDGQGLDATQIRKRAVERGLLEIDAGLSDQQVLTLITQTGFSTAEVVTRLSGRGVGMDVVSNEIKSLNGSLDVKSTAGVGTEFIIRLPLNLAVTKAIFVKIGGNQFAIPIASVDGVGRISREEMLDKLKSETLEFNYAGNSHKFYDLGMLLGLPSAKAVDRMRVPVLLSRSGQERIAISVDQVLGSQEIVVKPVGPQITSVPGIYGASILPDGGVIIILDLAPLVRHNAGRIEASFTGTIDIDKNSSPLVMVVDDSITMRKVTSRILERNNFRVLTARDGVEAIEQMATNVPDLVLLDIEMPRMDGYEVVQNMKADLRLNSIPIVMITSRTGDKHRKRAFDLGVERYLGKPYQELELVRQVNEIFHKQ